MAGGIADDLTRLNVELIFLVEGHIWGLEIMKNEQRIGLDPSIYQHAVVPSRKSVMSDRPRHELAALLPSDWDMGLACVLATLGMVPQAALHRFLASVRSVERGTGCDGWLGQASSRYGVQFDSAQLFALGNEKAIYNKVQARAASLGTFRSMTIPTIVDPTEAQGVRGLQSVWCLSPLGASALRAASNREPAPGPKEFSFPTSPQGSTSASVVHDAQLATILMSLLVDFARKAETADDVWDVVDIFGDGERFGTAGTAMFPDAVLKVLVEGRQATLILENDSGTMSEARIRAKASAYLRFMCSGADVFTWARPWLVFACPEGKLALHQRAIVSAFEEVGLLRLQDAGVGVGRIAVLTHEDVGKHGATADVYSLFSPRRGEFLGTKHGIADLAWRPERAIAELGWRCA